MNEQDEPKITPGTIDRNTAEKIVDRLKRGKQEEELAPDAQAVKKADEAAKGMIARGTEQMKSVGSDRPGEERPAREGEN